MLFFDSVGRFVWFCVGCLWCEVGRVCVFVWLWGWFWKVLCLSVYFVCFLCRVEGVVYIIWRRLGFGVFFFYFKK